MFSDTSVISMKSYHSEEKSDRRKGKIIFPARQYRRNRIGYEKPYLAWIPFANIWALGRLAEEYDNGKPRENIGKQLLSVYIAFISILVGALLIISVASISSALFGAADIFGVFMVFIFIPAYVLAFIFGVKFTIRQYLALWKIFRMFNPESSVGLLMLCIFLTPALPFVFFSISKNDPKNLRHEDDAQYVAYQDPFNPYYTPYPQQAQQPQYPQYQQYQQYPQYPQQPQQPQYPQYPQQPQTPEQNQNTPENPYKY